MDEVEMIEGPINPLLDLTFTTTRGKPTGKTLNMVTRDDRFNDLYAIVTEEYENWDEAIPHRPYRSLTGVPAMSGPLLYPTPF